MRTFLFRFIAVALAFAAQDAAALRQVRGYEFTVSSQTDPAVQAQAALRQVLVRATGARDAANDPALANVLAQAQIRDARARLHGGRHRLSSPRRAGADNAAAFRNVWPTERPLLWSCYGCPRRPSKRGARSRTRSIHRTGVASRSGCAARRARAPIGDFCRDAALAAATLGADAVLSLRDSVPTRSWRWVLTAQA